MNHYKVCVYALSKNDENYIDTWYESMKEADCIVVADTGSTDKTIEKLKDLGVFVYSIYVNPWRFDKARNLCLTLVPDDVDICICADLNETFKPGWRALLEAVWQEDTTRLRYTYSSCLSTDSTYKNERIHSRFHFTWIYPIHEILIYNGEKPDTCIEEPRIQLMQEPNSHQSKENVLKLLKVSEQEYPLYERNIFDLGCEYMHHTNYDRAITVLRYYLTLPTATCTVIRSAAMRFIAKCYKKLDGLKEATAWLFRSVAEGITIREPFLELAKIGYQQKNWIMTYYMVDTALAITSKTNTFLDEEEAWGSILFDLGSLACYQLGLYKQAYLYAIEAITYEPDNLHLLENLKLIELKYNAYLHLQKSDETMD